jgi:hypothetical protein
MAPDVRTFDGHSRGGGPAIGGKGRAIGSRDRRDSQGDGKVLSDRATTGFGGLIVVTAILLAVQAVTGAAAFPL